MLKSWLLFSRVGHDRAKSGGNHERSQEHRRRVLRHPGTQHRGKNCRPCDRGSAGTRANWGALHSRPAGWNLILNSSTTGRWQHRSFDVKSSILKWKTFILEALSWILILMLIFIKTHFSVLCLLLSFTLSVLIEHIVSLEAKLGIHFYSFCSTTFCTSYDTPLLKENRKRRKMKKKSQHPAGFEPTTFCSLDGCLSAVLQPQHCYS